jgi:hypothetical protein
MHDQDQMCWKQREREVDIGVYRARMGLFSTRKCKLLVNNYDIHIARCVHTWFSRLTIAVMLTVGAGELKLGPQMEEMLVDSMVEQRE